MHSFCMVLGSEVQDAQASQAIDVQRARQQGPLGLAMCGMNRDEGAGTG